jgi:hypothetical protein
MDEQSGKSKGTFDVTIAGEHWNFTEAAVTIREETDQQKVTFSTPSGLPTFESLSVRYVYNSTPGTVSVVPGEYATPGGSYGVTKQGGFTVHHAGSGTVTLRSADEASQAMSGTFSFQVILDGAIQTIQGSFDLYE